MLASATVVVRGLTSTVSAIVSPAAFLGLQVDEALVHVSNR